MSAVAEPNKPKPKRSPWSVIIEMVIGATLAGAVVWAYYSHAMVVRWADGIALGCTLVCFIAATRIFTRSLDAKALGEMMAVEGASTPRETGQARLQALLLLALGVTIAWPPIATYEHWPAPAWSYLVIVAFLAARIFYTNHVFQKGDEFVRQRIRDAAWRTYFVGQSLLMAYAGGERLGLFPPMNAWDVLVALTLLSIVMPAINPQRKVEA